MPARCPLRSGRAHTTPCLPLPAAMPLLPRALLLDAGPCLALAVPSPFPAGLDCPTRPLAPCLTAARYGYPTFVDSFGSFVSVVDFRHAGPVGCLPQRLLATAARALPAFAVAPFLPFGPPCLDVCLCPAPCSQLPTTAVGLFGCDCLPRPSPSSRSGSLPAPCTPFDWLPDVRLVGSFCPAPLPIANPRRAPPSALLQRRWPATFAGL